MKHNEKNAGAQAITTDMEAQLAAVEMAAPAEPVKKEVPSELKEILEIGKKGVTNKQMIPAMKKAVDENDTKTLELLKQFYPAVYESTTKYIGHARQEKLKQIV